MSKKDLKQQLAMANNDPRARLFQTRLGVNPLDDDSTNIEPEIQIPAKETTKTSNPTQTTKSNVSTETDSEQYERKTYYLTAQIVEAIRILSFENRKDISETVRELLEDAIPEEVLKGADENLKKLKSK